MQQLKISEWLNLLPEPYRTQSLEEFERQGAKDKKEKNISVAILNAFYFKPTKQGHDYWWRIYKNPPTLNPPTPQPAPVHTWIPVEDISKYSDYYHQYALGMVGNNWHVVEYDSEIGKYYNEYFPDIEVTHIMIIEPPKTTQDDHTQS